MNRSARVRLYTTLVALSLAAVGLGILVASSGGTLRPDRRPVPFELDEPPGAAKPKTR
jgi:hypothetical protein